jgi:hypothetical protein
MVSLKNKTYKVGSCILNQWSLEMCMRFVRDIIEGEGLGGEWKAHKS